MAVQPSSAAHAKLMRGLGELVPKATIRDLSNPTSGRDDAVHPTRTAVVLVDFSVPDGATGLAVKFYANSPAGLAALHRHATLLAALHPAIPVPAVAAVEPSPNWFGLPALVTARRGFTLFDEVKNLSAPEQDRLTEDVAWAAYRLHCISPGGLGMAGSCGPREVLGLWRADADWYDAHASRAGEFAALVRRGAELLRSYKSAPEHAALIHRDLHPYNLMVLNGDLTAIVDWDHAGLSSPYEDVAKAVIGLHAMLALSRSRRARLAEVFVEAYAACEASTPLQVVRRALPFGLDTVLDWIVGGKGASRSELAWAAEQFMAMAGGPL